MFNHAPGSYICPFCCVVAGKERDDLLTQPTDIVLRNHSVIAFVSSHWWPRNKGHVIIIPTAHIENIYDLPDEIAASIAAATRAVAIAMRTSYGCEGISTRQHNEPAGYQEVWHFHQHVFPRYADDRLYASDSEKYQTRPEDRHPYTMKLRQALRAISSDVSI
jgi:histidine triad (HIT) family protein